jgi:hypothetical protein
MRRFWINFLRKYKPGEGNFHIAQVRWTSSKPVPNVKPVRSTIKSLGESRDETT